MALGINPDNFGFAFDELAFGSETPCPTATVMDRLELFGTPYREPLVPRHSPAPVLVYDKEVVAQVVPSEVLSERGLKALHAKPLSKREINQRIKEHNREERFLESVAPSVHFASQSNNPFDPKAKALFRRCVPFSVTK